MDRRDHIRVLSLRWEEEALPEDVEMPIAPDEPHEVVAAQ
jgi:hypothetical protein